MSNYNHCVLVGNLTRDVEITYTPAGVCVGKFGLAINRTWKDEAGNKKEECSFIENVAFGKTAETLAEYVKKGHSLLVSGRLKQEVWEDKKTGEKRQAVKVIVESFTFLPQSDRAGKAQPPDNDEGPPARTKSAAAQTTAKARAESPPVDDGDDVPF